MRPLGGAGARQHLRLLAMPRFAAFCAAETVAFFGDSVLVAQTTPSGCCPGQDA